MAEDPLPFTSRAWQTAVWIGVGVVAVAAIWALVVIVVAARQSPTRPVLATGTTSTTAGVPASTGSTGPPQTGTVTGAVVGEACSTKVVGQTVTDDGAQLTCEPSGQNPRWVKVGATAPAAEPAVTTIPPTTGIAAPATATAPPAASPTTAAGCTIDPQGNCYQAGETCGTAADGGKTVMSLKGELVCEDVHGWRYDYPGRGPT